MGERSGGHPDAVPEGCKPGDTGQQSHSRAVCGGCTHSAFCNSPPRPCCSRAGCSVAGSAGLCREQRAVRPCSWTPILPHFGSSWEAQLSLSKAATKVTRRQGWKPVFLESLGLVPKGQSGPSRSTSALDKEGERGGDSLWHEGTGLGFEARDTPCICQGQKQQAPNWDLPSLSSWEQHRTLGTFFSTVGRGGRNEEIPSVKARQH